MAYNNRIYFLTVLETRSVKLGCYQSQIPSTGSRGQSCMPLPASGYFWHSLAYGCTTPVSDSVFSSSPYVLFLCVFLRRELVTGFRTHLDSPQSSHLEILNLVPSAKTFPPLIRSHSLVLGLGCSHIFLCASFNLLQY